MCIIQDSAADWAREADQMQLVYRNCVLDICAAFAENSHDGCYSERDPRLLDNLVVRWDGDLWRFNENAHVSDVSRGPIYMRAWVAQEIFLSPRKVHFGKDLVLWECAVCTASEGQPYQRPENVAQVSSPDPVRSWPDSRTWLLWQMQSSDYSKRALTFRKDKLVAFAGIAQVLTSRLARLNGGVVPDYLAGHWSLDLAQSLCWKASKASQLTDEERANLDYLAPSWSWMSFDNILFTDYEGRSDQDTVFVQVLSYGVTPLGESRFLQLKDGFIDLSGRLWTWKSLPLAPNETVYPYQTSPVPRVYPAWHVDYAVDVEALGQYILPIYCRNSGGGNTQDLKCLCILPVEGQPGRFRRIGYLNIWVEVPAEELKMLSSGNVHPALQFLCKEKVMDPIMLDDLLSRTITLV